MLRRFTSGRFRHHGARRTGVLVGAVALSASLLVACGGSSGTEPAGGAVLRVGVNVAPLSLDPSKDGTGTPSTVRSLAYEPLMYMNTDGTVSPALATEWGYTDDSLTTFEFTLRDDAKFSDGTAVNAEAVKRWFEYFVQSGGPTVSLMSFKSAEVVNQLTVRMHLSAPNPIVPKLLSDLSPWGAVAAPDAVAHPKTLALSTNGAGPYKLDDDASVEGDTYTYVPNPHYFDPEAVEFERVEVKVIADSNSMLQSIQAGQLDAAVGDPATAASAETSGLTVIAEDSGSTGLLILDREGAAAAPLGDIRVRRAMNYAIDRAAVAKALVGKYGTPSSEQQTADGFDSAYQDHYRYDPERARELMAEAGYENGFTIKVLSQGSAGSLGDPVARAMAKYLQDIGIKLDITTRDADFFTEMSSGKYPMIQMLMDNSLTWVRHQYIFTATSFFNVYDAKDAKLADLMASATEATDSSQIWTEISRYWTEQAYFVPAFIVQRVWYVAEGLEGVEFSYQRAYPSIREWQRS